MRWRLGAALVFLVAACLFVFQGCGGDDPEPPGVCDSSRGTIVQGPDGPVCQVRLTLLHTSDIHSRLLPFEQVITQIDSDLGLGALDSVANVGGVARMAYVLGRERARSSRVLHLDSGDCFQGAPIFNFFAGEPEVRALSLLGADAAVIGNHEFDRGPINVARQMQKWATFDLLAANYKWDPNTMPNNAFLGSVARPFAVFNREGLKIAVIGMANLSSLTSIFDQPNKLSLMPLSTVETAQFYIDLLRPHVDLIVMVTHMGLEVDQRMVRGTTGIDIVLGGHNHVVINPPQEIRDCSADPLNPGFVWAVDSREPFDPNAPPKPEHADPVNHPGQFKRFCTPRRVLIAHSGAFSKYVGRLDLVVTNHPKYASPTGNPEAYDPTNKFEVLSSKYTAFPIDSSVPEDPVMLEMLRPYARALDTVADLDILAGFSPNGARRISGNGGDSPLGNLVATAMWLRLGVQTDFSLTNSTGIRADLNPGPITIEQMYNIFPFDNSISKMQLSGLEVKHVFDFVARRSANRGCTSQAQIAGARIRINCAGCNRAGEGRACKIDADCPSGASGACEGGRCRIEPCAEQVYIGYVVDGSGRRFACNVDADCAFDGKDGLPGQCDKSAPSGKGYCLSAIKETNLYELATSTYLSQGGSGYRILQRNTTQFDTQIQQRDALIDYIRQGRACGWKKEFAATDGLKTCSVDADCATEGDFVCACPNSPKRCDCANVDPADAVCVDACAKPRVTREPFVCGSQGSCGGEGRCVRRDCRDQVAEFKDRVCALAPDAPRCRVAVNACATGGEQCKLLSCVDSSMGVFSDNRVEMIGR